jgi:hypothetical protein
MTKSTGRRLQDLDRKAAELQYSSLSQVRGMADFASADIRINTWQVGLTATASSHITDEWRAVARHGFFFLLAPSMRNVCVCVCVRARARMCLSVSVTVSVSVCL